MNHFLYDGPYVEPRSHLESSGPPLACQKIPPPASTKACSSTSPTPNPREPRLCLPSFFVSPPAGFVRHHASIRRRSLQLRGAFLFRTTLCAGISSAELCARCTTPPTRAGTSCSFGTSRIRLETALPPLIRQGFPDCPVRKIAGSCVTRLYRPFTKHPVSAEAHLSFW